MMKKIGVSDTRILLNQCSTIKKLATSFLLCQIYIISDCTLTVWQSTSALSCHSQVQVFTMLTFFFVYFPFLASIDLSPFALTTITTCTTAVGVCVVMQTLTQNSVKSASLFDSELQPVTPVKVVGTTFASASAAIFNKKVTELFVFSSLSTKPDS